MFGQDGTRLARAKLDEVVRRFSKATSPAPAPRRGFFEAQFARLEAALSRPAPHLAKASGRRVRSNGSLLEKL
jgi:hypothetical protein